MNLFRDVESLLLPLGYCVEDKEDRPSKAPQYVGFIDKVAFPFIRRVWINFYPGLDESTKWQEGMMCRLEVTIAIPDGTFERPVEDKIWFTTGIRAFVTSSGIIPSVRHRPKWQLGDENALMDLLTSQGLAWLDAMSQYSNHQTYCEKLWKEGAVLKPYAELYPKTLQASTNYPRSDEISAPIYSPHALVQLAYSAFWHDDLKKCLDYLQTYFTNIDKVVVGHGVEFKLLHHVESLLGAPKSE